MRASGKISDPMGRDLRLKMGKSGDLLFAWDYTVPSRARTSKWRGFAPCDEKMNWLCARYTGYVAIDLTR